MKELRSASQWSVLISSMGCAGLLSAQTLPLAVNSNPLDRLPQLQQPTLEPTAPTTTQLQLSRGLQPTAPLEQRVQVRHIEIAGVQSLPFEKIAQFFQPLSGKEVTLGQLAQAAEQATAAYHQAGYPLSFVYLPQQSLTQGVVRVTAVEGHITSIQVQGDMGKSEKLLREIVSPLMQDKPLRLEAFQRMNLLLARMVSLEVVPQAAMPQTEDGAVPLQLQVKRRPWTFGLGADMRQHDARGIASLVVNDPFWGGSQLSANVLLENPSKERMLGLNWRQWINARGTELALGYTDVKEKTNLALDELGLGGLSLEDITTQRKLQLSITHPLRLTPTGSTIVGGSIYGLNYGKEYRIDTFGAIEDREKVRAIQANVQWNYTHKELSHSASVVLTQGIDAMGAGSQRSTGLVLNPAKFDFTRLGLEYGLRWRSKRHWGAAFGIAGQLSSDSLPVSERVSFGGMHYGRGYRSGEAAGDRGVGVRIELNRMFRREQAKWVKAIEPFVMYEQANTSFHAQNFAKMQLKSTSVGLRLSDNRFYVLDVAASKPHGDRSPYNPQQRLRYSLSLTYRFQ